MSIRLTLTQSSEAGGGEPLEFILDEAVITLGRDKTCQVVLSQQAVSRNHARIFKEGHLFFLEDLGSAYGTQVNGRPLPKGEKRLLRDGDIIAIAQYDLRFDRLNAAPPPDVGGQKTAYVARNMVKDAMRGLSGGGEERYLVITNGPQSGERIELQDAQELVIGRDDSADLVFKEDLVSRRHVKIRRDWSGTHVEDLKSRNGIKVNRKRVTRATLKDGDELEVGGVRLVYVSRSEGAEEPSQPEVSPGDDEPSSKTGDSRSRSSRAKNSRKVTAQLKEEPPATRQEPPEQQQAEAPSAPPPPPEPPDSEPREEPPQGERANELLSEEAPPRRPTHERRPPTMRSAERPLAPPPEPEVLWKDKSRLVPLIALGLIGLLAMGAVIAALVSA